MAVQTHCLRLARRSLHHLVAPADDGEDPYEVSFLAITAP